MENQIMALPLTDVERMAQAIAKSGLFGVKTADQALALMLVAQAEGMHPAIAARDYHIIEGRPALKADAMLARFHSCGGIVEWHDLTDKKVSATFSHPQGGKALISWTWEMAERAQLTQRVQRDGKPNMWQKFPRQMLRSRVVSEGIRTVFPGVVVGAYTPEEIQDITDEPRNITPPADPEPPKRQTKKVEPVVDAEIVKPDPAPEKVEPRPAIAPDPTKSCATLAEKIKEARNLFNAQGVKTVSDLRAAVKFMLNRDIEGITDLSSAELNAVIAELQKKVTA